MVKLYIFFVAILAIFLSQLFTLTVLNGANHWQSSLLFLESNEEERLPRGTVIDRNGVQLAFDKEVTMLIVDTNIIGIENTPIDFAKLEQLPSEDETKLQYKVDTQVLQENILSDLNAINGITIHREYERVYPYSQIVSTILGYVQYDNNLQRYSGRYLLEEVFDTFLTSESSKFFDNQVELPTLALSIDITWQEKLYELLENYARTTQTNIGAATIIDIDTGELIALVSYPGFDPKVYSNGISEESFNDLNTDPSSPLVNHAYQSSFTPGSIFKLFTSFVLLDSETVNQFTITYSNGCLNLNNFEFCEYGDLAYGPLNIRSAIEKSSNIYFCENLAKHNDPGSVYNIAKMFDLGILTGIDLPNEARGFIDNKDYNRVQFGEGWYLGNTCNLAIGQGQTHITPLQAANLVSIIERNGKVISPKILANEINRENSYVEQSLSSHLSFDIIKQGMTDVTQSQSSILYPFFADLGHMNPKAKTGSAEAANGKVHSWIIGSFEHKGRSYAFSLFSQYGGGGYYITPVIQNFLNWLDSGV